MPRWLKQEPARVLAYLLLSLLQSVSVSLRQPPTRLLAMMVLNISVRARALMVSPLRIAAVRAVGAPELLLPMQKVAGSVSLQIGTF